MLPSSAERKESSTLVPVTVNDPKVKRIIHGDNPGITVLVLRELY